MTAQPLPALATPAFDGREIALTQASAATLQRLGLWDRIRAAEPNAPVRMVNSPTKPLVPGKPTAARVKTIKKAASTGMTEANPP